MIFQPPVIGLIYANLNQDLISIEKEIDQIYSALHPLEEKKFVVVEIIADASTKDITNFFQKYSRIHIFHFAGHANGNQVMIEDGGFRDGLKGFFSRQNELALVFLNGCNTAAQAKPFLEAGAKAVIATQFGINDKYAADFAITFYKSLAHPNNPKSIIEAFQDATDHITTKTGWNRSGRNEIIEYRGLASRAEFSDESPWKLFFRTEARTYLDWKINRQTVLLEKLRQGSRRYFDKLQNGRFQNLYIQDLILPKVNAQHPFFITDVSVENEEHMTLDNLLRVLWQTPEKRHFILMGEGGSGKTVSLVRLWERHLDDHSITAPVPIYIPLNEYNGWRIKHDWQDETDNFIVSFIARAYLTGNEAFTLEEKNAFLENLRKPIIEGVQGYLPSVLLLLDGFNEITTDQNDLIIALNWLHKEFPGLQIGLTSRHEMNTFVFAKNSTIAFLNPLDLQTITKYLKIQGVADPAKFTPGFDILLQNPMMLTLYTATNEVFTRYKDDQHHFDFKPSMTSMGEILWNFLESQRAKLFRDDEDSSEAADMEAYKLMIQYFLPLLGQKMVLKGKFYFLWNEIAPLLDNAIFQLTDPIFSERYDIKNKAFKLIKNRLELNDRGDNRITIDIVMDFLTRQLKILVVESEGQEDLDAHEELNTQYVFLHQNFRDFFAARYIQQQIKIAVRERILPEELKIIPINYYVRILLGELEGEHTNRMEWNPISQRWNWSKGQFFLENNLPMMLNLCRGIFDRRELGYTVWNILTIWNEQRGELSGADLSLLNLKGFSLNGIRICRPGLSTTFTKAVVPENALLPIGHSGEIYCASYSPDGRQILTGAADKTVKIWDAETGDCLTTFKGHWGKILSVCYHPDGRRIVSGGERDAEAKVWEIETGKCLLTLEGHMSWVRSVACSPNGRRILTASRDRTARIWDAHTGKCLLTLTGHSGEVNCAIYSPNGQLILTASQDKTVKVWDAETGNCIWTFTGDFYHLSYEWRTGIYGITNVSYSPDGRHIIVSTETMSKILNAETGECLWTLEGIFCNAYSPDGRRVVTGSRFSTAGIWDTTTGKCLMFLEGHLNEIDSVSFSPDGRRILTASRDHSAKVWDAESGTCLLSLEGYSDQINNAIFNPNGENILIGTNNHSAKVWDIKTGICQLVLQDPLNINESVRVSCSPNGDQILTWSFDVKVWDAKSGRCLLTLAGHTNWITSAVYRPDELYILTASMDGTAKVWSARSGECLLTLMNHSMEVLYADYSPDGQYILTGLREKIEIVKNRLSSYQPKKIAKLWDAKTGDFLLSFENLGGYYYRARNASFSKDGQHVLTVSNNRTAEVWNLKTRTCILVLSGHSEQIQSAFYSQDGKHIITSSKDCTSRVWDAGTGKCKLTLTGHLGEVHFAVDSPDGQYIFTEDYHNWSHNRTVKVWNANTGECLITLKEHSFLDRSTVCSPDGRHFLTTSEQKGNSTVNIWDIETGTNILTIKNIPGLLIQGCDFKNLHPDTNLSAESINLLKQYGGIFDADEAEITLF